MEEVYRAGRGRILRVRFFQLLMLAVAALFFAWGYGLGQSYGVSPGDGAHLRPLPERLAWAIGLWTLGCLCVAAGHAYVRRYVSRIQFGTTLGRVWITTLTGDRIMASMQELNFDRHEGASSHPRADGATIRVHAPWWALTVHGGKRTYIVDAQGATFDEGLFERLRGGR